MIGGELYDEHTRGEVKVEVDDGWRDESIRIRGVDVDIRIWSRDWCCE